MKTKTATQTRPPPAWVEEDVDDQLSKSRQLNSEGLEVRLKSPETTHQRSRRHQVPSHQISCSATQGLFPRATQLFQLGGSLFLSFLPFLLGISLLFGGIFVVSGLPMPSVLVVARPMPSIPVLACLACLPACPNPKYCPSGHTMWNSRWWLLGTSSGGRGRFCGGCSGGGLRPRLGL